MNTTINSNKTPQREPPCTCPPSEPQEPVPPCRYTVAELQARVAEAVEDVKAGRVYTMEEVRQLFPLPL